MNSSPLQGYLTTALAVISVIVSFLVKAGCVEIGNSMSCSASTLPSWMLPWLTGLGTVLILAKVVIGIVTGKLFAKTAIISETGKAGTVTQTSVDTNGR